MVRALLITVLLLTACEGAITLPKPPVETVEGPKAPALPQGFTAPEPSVQLLPFRVRMSKLQAAVGATATDPMFDELWAARDTLGDYDFAAGIAPDNSWTALRITGWVTALKPVCASSLMHQRYPDLPTNLSALIDNAYGRALTAEDTAAVTESLMGLTVTPAERYEALCLGVFSSLEFLSL